MNAGVRYVLGMLVGFAICAGAWSLYLWQFIDFRAEGNAVNIATWYEKKDAIARKIPSPKIVIAGGSGAYYGLSAKVLAQRLGVNALNYGTHAGLTLDYILHKVRKRLKPGDLVVLALEYEYYPRGRGLNATCVEYFIGGDPSYLSRLRFSEKIDVFFSPTAIMWLKKNNETPDSQRFVQETAAKETSMTTNEFGDRTGHTKNSMSAAQKQLIANTDHITVLQNPDMLKKADVWNELKKFADWCKRRDVTLIATYPNTIDHPSLHNEQARKNLQQLRKQYKKLGIPLYGEPEQAFLPREEFYDTAYHLTQDGQEARTQKFAEVIRECVEEWKSRQATMPEVTGPNSQTPER